MRGAEGARHPHGSADGPQGTQKREIREKPARRDGNTLHENALFAASPVQVVKVQQRWPRRSILSRSDGGAERWTYRSGALSARHVRWTRKHPPVQRTERQRMHPAAMQPPREEPHDQQADPLLGARHGVFEDDLTGTVATATDYDELGIVGREPHCRFHILDRAQRHVAARALCAMSRTTAVSTVDD